MRVQLSCRMAGCLLAALWQATAGLAAQSPTAAQPQPDPVSAECLACHDGSQGSRATFCLLTKAGGGHVISSDYTEAARRNPGIRPAGSLPSALVLRDGLITCTTCHGSDPHAGTSLAMTNDNSALCLGCHVK